MATASYSWNCPITPDYFLVYESVNGSSYTMVVQLPGTQTSWNHTNVAAGAYSSQVTALVGGIESQPCSAVTFQVIAPSFGVSTPTGPLSVSQRGFLQCWITLSSIAGFSGLVSLFAYARSGSLVSNSPVDGAGDDAGDGELSTASSGVIIAPQQGGYSPGSLGVDSAQDDAGDSAGGSTIAATTISSMDGVAVLLGQQTAYIVPGPSVLVSLAAAVSRAVPFGLFLITVVATSGGTTISTDVLVNVSGVEMTFTATGAFSIVGVGIEPSEGTMVAAQRLLDRTNGSIETDLTALARKSYRNQAAVAGYVAGASKTAGQLTIEPTSEGISRLLVSTFGNPTSTVLSGGTGSGATATSTVASGAVTAVSVTAGGTVYSGTPQVAFSGGGGTGAVATATVTAGAVTAISVISGGAGYSTAPTVTIIPAATFYQHVFGDGFGQGTVSIHEKRGNTFFSFGGCRCNGITATVNKTQTDPVTLMFDMMSLYEIVDMTAASIGLDGSVGYDVNGAFSPTSVAATFNNTLTAGAQSITVHPSKSVIERQVLDGFRGPNSHFVSQSNNTGNATLYFGDEVALNKYFGLLEGATGARGPSKSIIPVPLKLQITYNVDANGNVPGLTLFFPAAIYQRVGQPYRGPDAIMQDIAIMNQHDPTTGTSFQAILQNYEVAGTAAGQIAAAGTAITGVPVNAQNAYHS